MVANIPPQAAAAGSPLTQAAPTAASGVELPVGKLLPGVVQAPPPGSPSGAVLIALDNLPAVLVRASLPLQKGERVAVEAEGTGEGQSLRMVAKGGDAGKVLKTLDPGQIRLAQNQPLTSGLRSILANAKGTILGQILQFKNAGSAPVRIGSLQANFQLDSGAKPGERLFIQPKQAGGSLGLWVVARGGIASSPGPAGRAGLMTFVKAPGQALALPPSEAGLPSPGTILIGVVVRASSPAPGFGTGVASRPVTLPGNVPQGAVSAGVSVLTNETSVQRPEGVGRQSTLQNLASGEVLPQGVKRGISGAATSRAAATGGASSNIPQTGGAISGQAGQTALLRFSGFDAEVPWTPEAANSFPAGSAVRVFVNRVEPVLDLVLLAPQPTLGGAGYLPTGGAGESGYGMNLISLAEGLLQARGDVHQGELTRVFDNLIELLDRVVIKEDALSSDRLRETVDRGGTHPTLANSARSSGGGAQELQEALQQFLAANSESGFPSGDVFSELAGRAEQALTSLDFLQTANGLRHILDQGTYVQVPYMLGGEKGTMDVIIRRDGKGAGGAENDEHQSVVFLLELEGLGSLRVDAGLNGKNMHARFTTPSEEVGRFIEIELPKLHEALESQEFIVEGISWVQSLHQSEPVVPAWAPGDPSGENSFINLRI